MSARMSLTMVVLIAAVAFGGWRLLPQAERAADSAGESADAVVGTVNVAYFTAAEASLEAQRRATGSYVGTSLQPPVTLVRVDASSYCVQLDRPPHMLHLAGPGGTPASGPCR